MVGRIKACLVDKIALTGIIWTSRTPVRHRGEDELILAEQAGSVTVSSIAQNLSYCAGKTHLKHHPVALIEDFSVASLL